MSVDYQIENQDTLVDTGRCRLLLEVAPDHMVLAVLDNDSGQFVGLQYINLEKLNTLQHLKDTLYNNKWLTGEYYQVCIAYNFPDALLVPYTGYTAGNAAAYLNLVFGDLAKGQTHEDVINEWNVLNIYRVPASLHEVMTAHFHGASFMHAQTAFLKRVKDQFSFDEQPAAFVVFYERRFLLGCFQSNTIQLLKTFEYETAEDVNFHLLNVFNQLHIDCEATQLYVSGLLDTQSTVYTGLQKYFLKLRLDERPTRFRYSESFDAYPAHFFTSLFGIALCE